MKLARMLLGGPSCAGLDDKLRGHENNLGMLRLLFAAMVLFSHSYPLTGRADEWFSELTRQDSGGGIAVSGFFVISGFLVTQSLMTRGLRRYAVARVLRLVPALAVMSFICSFVLGALVTRLPLAEYFLRGGTWKYLENAFIFPVRLTLPGVFLDNPITAMNGSIWTLPLEAAMYVLLPACMALGLLSPRRAWILPPLAAAVLALGASSLLPWDPTQMFFWSLSTFWLAHYGYFFAAGVLLFVYRAVIPLSPLAAALMLGAGISWSGTEIGRAAWLAGLPYAVFVAAFAGSSFAGSFLGRWTARNDLSYGLYLYAFPVQQCFIAAFGTGQVGVASLTAMALPVALALAYCSWHWVERPALRMKGRWPGSAGRVRGEKASIIGA